MVHSLEWLRSEEIEFYECSGNICADIGLEDADGLLARAQIGVAVGSLVLPLINTPPFMPLLWID
jgi:hypothetical protein